MRRPRRCAAAQRPGDRGDVVRPAALDDGELVQEQRLDSDAMAAPGAGRAEGAPVGRDHLDRQHAANEPGDDRTRSPRLPPRRTRSSCAPGRVSSSTTARGCHCASSSRTTSSPVRAVERQWIRRRSSPTSYSRKVRNSSPSIAGAWKRTANGDELRSRPGAPGGSRSSCTRGQIVTSSASPAVQLRRARPNGSVTASVIGPSEYRPRWFVGTRYAARACCPPPECGDEEPRGTPATVEHVGQQELG